MRIKTATFFCLLWLLPISTAQPDDTDIITASWIDPNVLILLDSSGSMDDEVGGVPKIDIAKSVVTTLVQNTSNVRFGVMKFKSDGAEMVSEIGTPTATIVTAVNGMGAPSGGTPLGDALYDIGKYFHGTYTGYSSPIDADCRLNMVIVVSDGLQTPGGRDIRDEATLRFADDHSGAYPGTQNVIVHTVGFAIDPGNEAAANAILQQAATNGGGVFYSTDDAATLTASLESAVQSILADTFAFAGALVPSTSVSGSSKAYQASFLSDPVRPFWRGYLSAFQRGADGSVPTDANGVPLNTALVWEAGAQLSAKTAASRAIYTEVAGARQPLTKANGVITAGLLGVGTSGERDAVIDYVRGIDSFDEDGDGNVTEQRDWKLGDIIHSKPVLITPPVLISDDAAYQAFKSAQSSRTSVLIAGANDGLLHAFRDSDGEELWAFAPPDLLPNLKDLGAAFGAHPYYVDGSPVAADIKISGVYKTAVVFGERRGGRSYHALDVTDTTNPGVMWSFTDARIGETWSAPAIGRIDLSVGEKYVAFVGGGYDTAQNNNTGKIVYAIDVATGVKLWEFYDDATVDDRQYMNYSIAASPTLLDLDGNGYVDRVYIGDVGGQMWKFDVSADAVASWTGKRLFAAAPAQANPPPAGPWSPTQAIYGAPAAAMDDIGNLWIYFGTGDLNNPTNASQNRLYGLKETTDMSNGAVLTESDMADVTTTNGTGTNGWYVRLASEEKSFSSPGVFRGDVFFTTFTSLATITCNSGAGPASLYSMDMDTGYAAIDWSTGEELVPTDATEPRSTSVGTGIPGDPTVVATVTDGVLDGSIATGTTDQQLDRQPIPDVALRQILSWREIF